jgi:hypothetical protein
VDQRRHRGEVPRAVRPGIIGQPAERQESQVLPRKFHRDTIKVGHSHADALAGRRSVDG